MHEDALVGLQLKASNLYGSFDGERRFLGAPAGATELDFRARSRGQHPRLQARPALGDPAHGGDVPERPRPLRRRRRSRRSPARRPLGFHHRGLLDHHPGIALAAGALLPTGRAPEASSKPLATDATGIGAFQGSVTLALEQTFGPWLVNVTGSAAWRAPRTVGDVHAQQGLQLVATAAGGYSFASGPVVALTLAYTAELDATINGETLPGSGRAATRIGVAGGVPFNDLWRMQGSLATDLPIRYFGFNQPASVALTLMILRSWT